MPDEAAAPAAPVENATAGAPNGAPPAAASSTEQAGPGEEELGEAGRRALEAMKAERNAANTRARQAERELERVRAAGMSEADRAIAEAEKRGETNANSRWGQRLVRSEFAAAAAKRNPAFDAAAVLDDLNLARFVGDDGEPNTAEIAKSVERLVPAPSGTPVFDTGVRTTAPAGTGMDAIIRGRVGARPSR